MTEVCENLKLSIEKKNKWKKILMINDCIEVHCISPTQKSTEFNTQQNQNNNKKQRVKHRHYYIIVGMSFAHVSAFISALKP